MKSYGKMHSFSVMLFRFLFSRKYFRNFNPLYTSAIVMFLSSRDSILLNGIGKSTYCSLPVSSLTSVCNSASVSMSSTRSYICANETLAPLSWLAILRCLS